jgi:hypothetical protein
MKQIESRQYMVEVIKQASKSCSFYKTEIEKLRINE